MVQRRILYALLSMLFPHRLYLLVSHCYQVYVTHTSSLLWQCSSLPMGCGLVAEYALEKSMDNDNGMYMIAWIAHLTGWLGVSTAYGILFATTNIVLNSGVSEGPPAFVWVIIIFQFLAFMSFGFVQFAQLMIRDVDTERAEQAYIMLSLIAKTQLTWNIFFSVG